VHWSAAIQQPMHFPSSMAMPHVGHFSSIRLR
jgi:hypothetical protein